MSVTFGDSMTYQRKMNTESFFSKLDDCISGTVEFTIILKDPLANSWIYSPFEEGKDERLKVEEYERSYEDNEELGINDMKTENY